MAVFTWSMFWIWAARAGAAGGGGTLGALLSPIANATGATTLMARAVPSASGTPRIRRRAESRVIEGTFQIGQQRMNHTFPDHLLSSKRQKLPLALAG